MMIDCVYSQEILKNKIPIEEDYRVVNDLGMSKIGKCVFYCYVLCSLTDQSQSILEKP